ncbi:MAG TPA: beta-galactosidase GalA [Bacteroidota bacterium]|nr:beta-galactosidase GalA [Bacteroidota bacterium]
MKTSLPTTKCKLGLKIVALLIGTCLSLAFGQQRGATPANTVHHPVREKLLLDFGWKFHLGDAADPKADFDFGVGTLFAKAGESHGAVHPNFNDSSWRTLDLPHDWAVEQDFVNVKDEDVMSHGYKPTSRLFPKTTIGWYRRAFVIPSEDLGKRLSVKFDGVFRDCVVWLNGHYLGNNLSGYSEFSYDITDYARYGQKNVLVVRVDASQYEGWFYEGAGIYRHTWLIKTEALHIPEYGVFVHTEVGEGNASVIAQTDVLNQDENTAECEVTTSVVDASGNAVGRSTPGGVTVGAFQRSGLSQRIEIKSPTLWSVELPYLYTLVSVVRSRGVTTDSVRTPFGIRTIRWDKDRGFFLNGKRVELKGTCNHQDHAGVGSALPDRLQYYRIEKLKEMGSNAYRTSHNPPTNELLEACDRLGMLVMDENRLMGSTPEFMGQFETLVKRDRNHPCVVLWSLGNEEWVIQNTDVGKRVALSLIQKLKELDPTRLYSYAANNGNTYEGINSVLPIRGFNYMTIMDIDKYRKDHPGQILFGSEEASTLCTRGIYTVDTVQGYMSDYDVTATGWGATAEKWWTFYNAREWLAGAFVWTGFDYRGEPTPYSWPCINSHFGIMDVCGFPKTNFFYYQSWWSNKDVLHLAPHWNWSGREGKSVKVWCESNCESVELFLNGKSQGRKTMNRDSHLEWDVRYEPGVLEARGIRGGRLMTTRVETSGQPASVRLTVDRTSLDADGEDVGVVTVQALDKQGKAVPTADNLIRFALKGHGRIIGVGNGDPSSHEADKFLDGKYQRRLFNGYCQVIVQSAKDAGTIELEAVSEGLKPAVLALQSIPVSLRPSVAPYTITIDRHKARGKTVTYAQAYHERYPAGGTSALVDGIHGSADFKDGFWQGFEKNDLDVVIDLGIPTPVSRISSTYLQDIESWIFLPTSVEYFVSNDGTNFTLLSRLKNEVPQNREGSFTTPFTVSANPQTVRYVRVVAKNVGTIPTWHRSSGEKAWLFVDEVVVD